MSLLDKLALNRIFKDGTPVNPTRKVLNFIGAAVTVEDDPANDRTNITIAGDGTEEGTITGPGTATPGHVTVWGADATEIADGGVALSDLVTQSDLDEAIGDIHIPSSGGDVLGPSSSADNTIARFDGANSKTIQSSLPKVEDDGRISSVTDPVSPQDADTKAARDAAISAARTGGAWSLLKDVAFASLAHQSITTGRNTIGGLECWTRYRAGFSTLDILNGTGLRLVSNRDSWAGSYGTAGDGCNGLHIPLDQIPGFKLGEPFLLIAQAAAPTYAVDKGPVLIGCIEKVPLSSTPTLECVAESSVATDAFSIFADGPSGTPRMGATMNAGAGGTGAVAVCTRANEVGAPSILTSKSHFGEMDIAVEFHADRCMCYLGMANDVPENLALYAEAFKAPIIRSRRAENRRPVAALTVQGVSGTTLWFKRLRVYQRQ